MKTREEKRKLMEEFFDCVDLSILTEIVLDKINNEAYTEGVQHGIQRGYEEARQKTLQRDGYKDRKSIIGRAGEKFISTWTIDDKEPIYIKQGDLILASYEVKTETKAYYTGRVTVEVYDPVYKRNSGLRTSTAHIWYFCDYYENDGTVGLGFYVSTRRMKEVITYIKKEILPYTLKEDKDVEFEDIGTAHNYYVPPYYFNMTNKQLQRQAKLTKLNYEKNAKG